MAGISTPVDNTSYLAFLKKYYIGKKALYQLDSYKTPLIGMMKKDLGAGGSTWEQTVGVTNVVGGSATYANAYNNSTQGVDKVFSGNFKKRFADVKIQDFTVRSSNGDGGIERVMKRKIDTLKSEFMQTLNYQAYRDEGGSLIQLVATTGSNVVFNGTATATDSTKAGIQFIKVDKTLNMGAALAGTGLEQSAGTPLKLTITGRNVSAGTFSYTANTANAHPSGSAYLFEDGSAGLSLAGLRSWCPLTDTLAATTFKTVDRSIDVNGLGGIRVAAVGSTIEESLNEAVAVHRQLGGDPDICLIHPKRFAQLKKELGDRVRYVETKGKPLVGANAKNSFSFRGIEIDGNGRPVVVHEDAACQTECTWIIESDVFVARSMGKFPYVPDEDGLLVRRLQGTDQWQSELFAYLECICARPQSLLAVCHDNSIV